MNSRKLKIMTFAPENMRSCWS